MLTDTIQERALTFREVNEFLGLRCKTSHTVRNMARRGQIRAIQINGRVMRYSLASVRNLLGETTRMEGNRND